MIWITFEEKVLKHRSHEAYLDMMNQHGVRGFELGLDWGLYKDLKLDYRLWQEFDYAYHVPYHLNAAYGCLQVKTQSFVKSYDDFFTLVDLTSRQRDCTLVVHLDTLNVDQALVYIDFLLNRTSQVNLPLKFALETTYSPKLSVTRDHLKNLLAHFNEERLGLCVDLTHEYRMGGRIDKLEDTVIHGHVHGFTDKGDHIYLSEDNKRLLKPALSGYMNHVPLVLETLYHKDYFLKIQKDLQWLCELSEIKC